MKIESWKPISSTCNLQNQYRAKGLANLARFFSVLCLILRVFYQVFHWVQILNLIYLCTGTAPLNTDVLDYTSVGVASYVVVRGLSLQSGLTYYATIRATDFTGRHGYVVSSGVRIDTSEPIVGGIRLTDIASFQTNLQLEWNLVTDSESDITSLEWSLGTRLGSSDITGWRSAGMEQNTGLVINTTQFNLYDGQILFASLKVRTLPNYLVTSC